MSGLLDLHEMSDGLGHAHDLGTILFDDRVADALQPERPQGVALNLRATDLGTNLGDLDVGHQTVTSSGAGASAALALASAAASASALSSAAGATSSTARPRRLATASGDSSVLSASTVAWT